MKIMLDIDEGLACCNGGTQSDPCGCHGARLTSKLLVRTKWVTRGGDLSELPIEVQSLLTRKPSKGVEA